jgi:4'-phosphopantetheinyl transferase
MTQDTILWICEDARLVGAEALDPLLDAEERSRRSRFRFEHLARQYTVAHGLLRLALTRRCPQVPPVDWRFAAGPQGKPGIAPGLPPLSFSLAHTRGLVAIAVGAEEDGQLGLDAENAERNVDLAVADRFFAPAEVRDLLSLPDGERLRRFFTLWSLKESFLKATGLGMSLPLASFSFAFPDAGMLSFARHVERMPEPCRTAPGAATPVGPGTRDYGFAQMLLDGTQARQALAICLPADGPMPDLRVEVVEAVHPPRGGQAAGPDVAARPLESRWDWRTF